VGEERREMGVCLCLCVCLFGWLAECGMEYVRVMAKGR
jgi:hypothetical protein